MSPYSWSCQADIVDGSVEGCGTVDICRQSDALLQYVTEDSESCRTRLITTASTHRHILCRAINASTEMANQCSAKTLRPQHLLHIIAHSGVSFKFY